MVAAALAVAESVIASHSEGHLLAAWIALWAVAFASIAMFAGREGGFVAALAQSIANRNDRRARRSADQAYLALARRDPRIMEELIAAAQCAQVARAEVDLVHGRAWLDHRPRDTLNAAYAGPRRSLGAAPMTSLTSQLQMQPG
jgi:hypothetical protein